MSIFNKAKWIWFSADESNDEYGDFFNTLKYVDGNALLRISCDGDYTLYINGVYAASNQYGDFEHYKIYDEIDISSFLKLGENTLSVTVWHHGTSTSRYAYGRAGVIFEVISGGELILSSGEGTLARKNPAYSSGRCKLITAQLGYGFAYDANYDDGALFTGEGFVRAVEINKQCVLYPRPNKKLTVADKPAEAKITSGSDGKYHLIDLGRETVGLLHLNFKSETSQKLRIDWGEDLQGGHVRRLIGNRDFSVDYTARAGENSYTNYMLRFGARYLEVYCEEPIELRCAGLIPVCYPVTPKTARPLENDEKRIYELCLKTLELCMMEHYVDCPWREQAFYAFDSRNQMLCGYYAFEDGNREYARSNLELINQDAGISGLLSICFPSKGDLAIPSFSLHLFGAVLEYIEHTGDLELGDELYPKLDGIIKTFKENSEDRLICRFYGKEFWNFYDWTRELDGADKSADRKTPDSVINLLFLKALQALKKISVLLGTSFEHEDILTELPALIKNSFFDEKCGLYSLNIGDNKYTSLSNSLAVITGTSVGDEAALICEKIVSGALPEGSLSLKCFDYDALMQTNVDKYRGYILDDIKKNYMKMINCGATSAWETIVGASDFGNAGSLCHGWSAMPIYYYHVLGVV